MIKKTKIDICWNHVVRVLNARLKFLYTILWFIQNLWRFVNKITWQNYEGGRDGGRWKKCHVRSYFSNELLEDKEGPRQAVSNENEEEENVPRVFSKYWLILVMENKDNKEPLINNVEENNQSALNWHNAFFSECNPYTGTVYKIRWIIIFYLKQ